VSDQNHDSLVEHFGEFGDRLRGDSWQPDVDVFETETALVVRAEIAGVRSQDLNVKVDGQVLRIAGTRAALDGSSGAHRVESFREKPDASTAESFVEAGNFFWNSGMFFWRPEVILEEVRRHRPELARGLERFEGRLGEDQLETALDELFPTLESISIDYAVMEHSANVAMLEAPFEWDDLGSWKAWARWQPKDDAGNVVQGEVVLLDSEDCVVVGESAPVAVIGVKDLVIVQKNGATLICPVDRAEEVRRAVNELQKREKS